MKTLLAILAAMVLLSCDGGECGQEVAGADECWPGPGLCWMYGDPNVHRYGICCTNSCLCSLAEKRGPDDPIMLHTPFRPGCVDDASFGGYSCDGGCSCSLPTDGVGVIIELPQ